MTGLSRSARSGAAPGCRLSSGEAAGTPFALPSLLAFLRGAAWLLLAGLSSSCLVPQNVDRDSTTPHHPPRIIIDQIPATLLGPFVTLVRASRDTCHCELELAIPEVAEDDPTVDLDGRWFIDYDPHNSATWGYRGTSLGGTFDDFTKVIRPGPTYAIDPDTLGLADGFHTVEILLAERGAFNDDAVNPQAPNRTIFKDYEAASYRFFVRVVTDPDVPQCPQAAPFTRFCGSGGQP